MKPWKINELVPNIEVRCIDASETTLWEFRQISHIVLVNEMENNNTVFSQYRDLSSKNDIDWNWLNVKFVSPKIKDTNLECGIYLIDRFGILLKHYPSDTWNFPQIEKDFLYYESCHC